MECSRAKMDSKLTVMKFMTKKESETAMKPHAPPTYHTVQLATRFEGCDVFPRLWSTIFFSGIDSIILGFHNGGRISGKAEYRPPVGGSHSEKYSGVWRFQSEDVTAKFGGLPVAGLMRFVDLMKRILVFVRERSEGMKWALVYDGNDCLKIYERRANSQSALPESYRAEILKK